MKWIPFILIISMLVSCKSENETYQETRVFQLAAPIVKVDSNLFKNSAELTMNFGFPDSQIRYTIDGKEVDQSSTIYSGPIHLKNAAIIKAKAFHNDFKSSDQTEIQVAQIVNNIFNAAIEVEPQPHENYKGMGAPGLIDLHRGGLQFRGSDKWLGFQANPVIINIDLKNELELSLLKVGCLLNQGGWIFAPESIKVYSNAKEVGKVSIEKANDKQDNQPILISIPIEKGRYSHLKLLLYSLNEIPQWHQGKGSKPWLFLDEILVE